jgi:FKBP-type peptidyl-prolyl cis-trans isomerase SlpA
MKTIETNSTVSVHYTGKLEDGTIFDTSLMEGRQALKATLGQGQLIPGFEQGLQGMTVGDKKTLIKKLKYFLDPVQDVLNTHTGRKIPKDKEIVGVTVTSTEKINAVLKKKGQFLYYALGYQYYLVDKAK